MGGVPSPLMSSNRRPACVMSAVVAFVHACEGRTTTTARATAGAYRHVTRAELRHTLVPRREAPRASHLDIIARGVGD